MGEDLGRVWEGENVIKIHCLKCSKINTNSIKKKRMNRLSLLHSLVDLKISNQEIDDSSWNVHRVDKW